MNIISDIKLTLVEQISNKSMHIRGIEEKTKIPKSTISDKFKELYNDNIVDFTIEGRNKEYYIKDSFEAGQYLKALENYKLLKLVNKYPKLKPIIKEIYEILPPRKILVIFGSYSKKIATKNSDIDIYIHTKSTKLKEENELINSKISVKIGNLKSKNNLTKEIMSNYVIVQGVEYFLEIKNERY